MKEYIMMVNGFSKDYIIDQLNEALQNYLARPTKRNEEDMLCFSQMLLSKKEIETSGVEKLIKEAVAGYQLNQTLFGKGRN